MRVKQVQMKVKMPLDSIYPSILRLTWEHTVQLHSMVRRSPFWSQRLWLWFTLLLLLSLHFSTHAETDTYFPVKRVHLWLTCVPIFLFFVVQFAGMSWSPSRQLLLPLIVCYLYLRHRLHDCWRKKSPVLDSLEVWRNCDISSSLPPKLTISARKRIL